MYLQKTILTGILSCFISLVSGQQILPLLPKSKHDLVVIAHRGSHLVKPENTIAAIEDAILLGADYVEVDLRTTLDGHLILSHNAEVNKHTNGKGLIKDLKLEEIEQLLVNSKDGGIYRIPGFSEVLKTCKNRINIYLDFKDADAEQTYREIKAAGMEKQILVYLNKAAHYEAWKKAAPEMPLMTGLSENIRTKEDLKEFLLKTSLQATDNLNNQGLFPALKENKLSVFLDVQNKQEGASQWQAAINKGVQGLQTDHPAALIQYLKDNNLRNTNVTQVK